MSNYDPVVSGYWWVIVPILTVYYYLLFGAVRAVVMLIRSESP